MRLKGNDGIIRTGDRLSDYEVLTSQDIQWKTGNLLEIGVFGLEIGRSQCRWRLDRETFLMVFLYRVIQDSEIVSAVKVKTVLVISNIFFQNFLKCYWTRVSSSLTAALKVISFFLLNHHSGAVFFMSVSILRIPTRYQMPFNLPLNEDCS